LFHRKIVPVLLLHSKNGKLNKNLAVAVQFYTAITAESSFHAHNVTEAQAYETTRNKSKSSEL